MTDTALFQTPQLWHGLLGRGITLVLVAVVALAWPISTLEVLLLIGATGAIVVGVVDLGVARHMRRLMQPWWALALPGALAIVLGAIVLVFPLASLGIAAGVLAAWLLVQVAVLVQWAIVLRDAHRHSAPLAIAAVLSLVLAATALLWPRPTLLVLLALMAGYALAMGVVEIGVALWLRRERTVPA